METEMETISFVVVVVGPDDVVTAIPYWEESPETKSACIAHTVAMHCHKTGRGKFEVMVREITT